MTQPPEPHTRAATRGQAVETRLASGQRLREPLVVTALFEEPDLVDRALDALIVAGIPRDLIEVVVSRQAVERFYASAPRRAAPRVRRETWTYAGVGALLGFLGGVVLSLIMVAWPGIEAPGGLALVQLAGPNFGTMAGAAVGAVFGATRRQRPKPEYARAAEASNAILFAVASRSEEEARLIAGLLERQGAHDIRVG